MPLRPINEMMRAAKEGGYAVGYFESWSIDSLQGVVDAAERTRSPIIIGFNGEFLSEGSGMQLGELGPYAALGAAMAAKATVSCGFIFNECSRVPWLERAITVGFNLIMPADLSTAEVKRLAQLAHANEVAIEAEVEADDGDPDGPTDPERAAEFVRETKADLLAVTAGNEEIKLQGRAPLDLDRLEAIRRRVDVPMVLHGGTGIDDASISDAVRLGVHKINYGTYMKQSYLAALRNALDTDEPNPHEILGGGVSTDILVVMRQVIRDAVLERIELLGCCGKA